MMTLAEEKALLSVSWDRERLWLKIASRYYLTMSVKIMGPPFKDDGDTVSTYRLSKALIAASVDDW